MPLRNGKTLECNACNKEYYVAKNRVLKSKFCSVKCLNITQHESIEKICKGCNKNFKCSKSRKERKFCSMECRSISINTTRDNRKIRKNLHALSGRKNSRTLRLKFFRIFDSICDLCGIKEESFLMDLHHIDEDCNNNEIDNLSILCCFCHRKYHKKRVELTGVSDAAKKRELRISNSL